MKKPILAIRCAKCGAVYLACALAYGINEETSEAIKTAVTAGDEIFIAHSVILGECECD